MTDPIVVEGVAYASPPGHLLADATRIVESAVAELKPGSHGALIGVGTQDPITGRWSANAAIVQRFQVGDRVDFAIVGWVGKKWGEQVGYGGGAKVEW